MVAKVLAGKMKPSLVTKTQHDSSQIYNVFLHRGFQVTEGKISSKLQARAPVPTLRQLSTLRLGCMWAM